MENPIVPSLHYITAILWFSYALVIFHLGLRIRKQGENIKAVFVNEYNRSLIFIIIFATINILSGSYLVDWSSINIFELSVTLTLGLILGSIAYLINIYQLIISRRYIKNIDRYLNANITLSSLVALFLFLTLLSMYLAVKGY